MTKNNTKLIKNNKGFTIAELSVAILIMIMFTGVIVTIFTNLHISLIESRRQSVAMLYATQIAERVDKLIFDEVNDENIINIDIPEGYTAKAITKLNSENTVKTVDILVSYIVGNNQKQVKLQKIKTRDYLPIPNAPVIKEGMVPIQNVEENGDSYWIIASSDDVDWYNYYTGQWANMMLLDGATTDDGSIITESNKQSLVGQKINKLGSMFVWIPRYAYKITDKTIEIQYLYGNTNDYLESQTNYTQQVKNISEKEGYQVHPSFTNGTNNNYSNGEWNTEIEGFWVAKYAAGFQNCMITEDIYGIIYPTEDFTDVKYSDKKYTSYNISYTKNALNQNLSSIDYSNQYISYPVFKPLTYAYNLISIDDCYTIANDMANATSFYGLDNTQSETMLMKNSQWGAVAYLTYSKYGKDGATITRNSRNINNSNRNIYAVTGYSSTKLNDVSTSSTGNMTGVFDLNGCIWERVADYISTNATNLTDYGNTLVKKTSNKLSTIYPYNQTSNTSIENWKILKANFYRYGDAISEISSESNIQIQNWSGNIQEYPNDANNIQFFMRGSYYGENDTGIFSFKATSGAPNINEGFRVVII